jgi:hypothetical protein
LKIMRHSLFPLPAPLLSFPLLQFPSNMWRGRGAGHLTTLLLFLSELTAQVSAWPVGWLAAVFLL